MCHFKKTKEFEMRFYRSIKGFCFVFFRKKKNYFIDYLGFRSSESSAFTLTVVNGLSPSIMMEYEAIPDLDTSTNMMLYSFFLIGII